MNKSIISLTLRFVIGLNFLLAPIAHFGVLKFYAADTSKISSWITELDFAGNAVALSLLLISVLLLLGFRTTHATVAAISLIVFNHLFLLLNASSNMPFSGPFYNTFYHTVPFLGFSLLLLYTLPQNKFSLDNLLNIESQSFTFEEKNEILFLVARVFVGAIFLAQGLYSLTGEQTVTEFAATFYVKAYASTMIPEILLWSMGILNPWIELVGGLLLVVGFKVKWAAYLLAFFMVSIAFGHLFNDPFETSGDISMYGFNNLAFVLIVLWFESGKNKYALDRFTI